MSLLLFIFCFQHGVKSVFGTEMSYPSTVHQHADIWPGKIFFSFCLEKNQDTQAMPDVGLNCFRNTLKWIYWVSK